MDKLIEKFADQLREAVEIGRAAKINKSPNPVHQVYIAGLGGSGIGGDFISEWVRDHCPVPLVVGKRYSIPAWVDSNTLAIVSSYSGNTEETLSSFDRLLKSGARLVCISSGGRLMELAREHNIDRIQIPGDWPSPRACLGYSVVQQLFVLYYSGLIDNDFEAEILQAADLLDREEEDIRTRARQIAGMLVGKTPVIYIADRMEPVAVRWRQQINENSKMLCWHNVIPEMNHNELVGWRDQRSDLAVVMLRNRSDLPRIQMRMEINKEIISEFTNGFIELYSKGTSAILRSLYLVHLGDWVSFYLAELRNKDAVEVKVIDYLKAELARTKNE